jgi:antitoxin FitA
MTNVTLKNVPEGLYQRLKALAEANHRSINSEIIVCLERATSTYQVDRGEILERARLLRELTASYPITDEELRQAKADGRP